MVGVWVLGGDSCFIPNGKVTLFLTSLLQKCWLTLRKGKKGYTRINEGLIFPAGCISICRETFVPSLLGVFYIPTYSKKVGISDYILYSQFMEMTRVK